MVVPRSIKYKPRDAIPDLKNTNHHIKTFVVDSNHLKTLGDKNLIMNENKFAMYVNKYKLIFAACKCHDGACT